MLKKRENDEITGLFRNRLSGAEMPVREGFWEELERELPPASFKKQILLSPKHCRIAAAASIVLVLGAASAAFWYFSPKEEIKEAFTQVAAMTPEGSLNGDVIQESFPSIHQATPMMPKNGIKQPTGSGIPAGLAAQADEEEAVSVRVSIRITQRVYGNARQSGNGFYDNVSPVQNGAYHTDTDDTDIDSEINHADVSVEEAAPAKTEVKKYNRAVKVAVGTSLPKDDFHMSLTAGISMEAALNKSLSLEAGLQYNRLGGEHTLHTLGIPVKLNMMLASTPKVDLYAMVGGAAEKCIAGAPDNGFEAKPVQLSVVAGVGVRYKMSDRFALFAEPSVSHHFDTDSQSRTLRTERPTNLNLLCGVRVTY